MQSQGAQITFPLGWGDIFILANVEASSYKMIQLTLLLTQFYEH